MGHIRPTKLVTPLVAILYANTEAYKAARDPLIAMLGPVALESPVFEFRSSDYYAANMGGELRRVFLAFRELARPDALADWKHASNQLEAQIAQAQQAPRPINLDPGYITGAKLVLASTKDFAHRIAISDTIFAEVTLLFRHGRWLVHPYTFPEYCSLAYHAFFAQVRDFHVEAARIRSGAIRNDAIRSDMR